MPHGRSYVPRVGGQNTTANDACDEDALALVRTSVIGYHVYHENGAHWSASA
jgi:hypothetical protein